MARESLFNVLNNQLDFSSADVLDLFSGTGAIAFEFASRGAVSVDAVDINFKCTRFIKQIADQLEFNQLSVFRSDFIKFLKRTTKKWDVIFADPPYAMKNIPDIYQLVFENQLLRNSGILIIEHDLNLNFEDFKGFTDHRKYGKVNFSFFRQSS